MNNYAFTDSKLKDKSFDIINYSALFLFCFIMLYPFIYTISVSISSPEAVGYGRVKLLPIGFDLSSYSTILKDPTLLRSYINSIMYTVTGVFLQLLFATLAAYPLAQQRLKGKTFIVIAMSLTMYVSGGMIPTYILIMQLQMIDTIWAITLPAAFAMWYIILLRTNIQALPKSLFEAARINGANDWYILLLIVIPLSKAIYMTLGLFSAVAHWNNFFGPLLYLISDEKMPLPILLRKILIIKEDILANESVNEVKDVAYEGKLISTRMACTLVTIGPIMLIYPFIQKHFVKGILVGSIKG